MGELMVNIHAEKIIYDFGEKEGLAVGICTAQDFEELRNELERENPKLKGFAEQDIEKRIFPNISMENPKTIIVLGMGYGKKENFPKDKLLRGVISQGAVGMDYHIVLKEKLEKLMGEIKTLQPDFNYKIYTDTGPLVDRAVALRSGIGFLGRNFAVINKKLGSKMFIGYAITDLDLEAKNGGKSYCRGCGVCVKLCPTGAIKGCEFYMEKCISYITQKKGILRPWEMIAIGKSLYGCDICQNACPENNGVDTEEVSDIDVIMPQLKEILCLSNREFIEKYGNTAMGWRGNTVIKRNAICVLGNSKSRDALDLLKDVMYKNEGVLRSQSVLAIGILGFEEGIEILETAKKDIQDENFVPLAERTVKFIKGEEAWDIGIPEA